MRGTSTGRVPGLSQMPKSLPREEQHLEPTSELTRKVQEHIQSDRQLFSEDEPELYIAKQNECLQQEPSEEQFPVNPEQHHKIKVFYFKCGCSSEK
jgi:hypothetical protein